MFEIVKNKDMLSECFKIREEVFVKEQGVPLENELDSYEENSIHIIGYDNYHNPFACARFRPYEDGAKVERVAILKTHRQGGYGQSLMLEIEKFAKDKGYQKLILNAQVQAQGFYTKLGYTPTGEVFLEENIKHIKMFKAI
ncbi:GNAT family N-acetyltransferase [Staphylococcus caledonicus]|uniref:GNAT family N-acetyltransferase n=1 Tax=Staphylococcus caledonicus TaxID=2741333 RepID=UPI0018E42638|nr:GNAT family N-acetyltransferase [Staphylococcus caledonicus]MBI5972065.1 GNAT family N-acetyltransferase [Staphylococcus caledonicus]